MQSPHISVITICYNARKELAYTFASVFSQTYPHVEYIVIDGNSSDGTKELIEKNRDKISYFVSEKDKGIYDAMNKGLKAATGDYVIFMNAGDEFYSEHTIQQVFSSTPGADIYYGQTRLVNEAREDVGERVLRAPEKLNWKSFRMGMLVCHQAIFIRRSMAPLYDLQYRIASDIDWVIKCLKASKSRIYIPDYICRYLVGGTSHKNEHRAWKERFMIMKRHYGLFPTLFAHTRIIIRRLFS